MTNTTDQTIALNLPFNRYDGQRVSEWLEETGRTSIRIMLMEFDATEYSYESIRHALISVLLSGTTPWHQVVNKSIKAHAGVVNTQYLGEDINLRLVTTHWTQEEPFKTASFWSNRNMSDDLMVSIWFEYRSGGMHERMYAAFLVESTWRVLEFSRMATY